MTEKFEQWGILELMGHQRCAGRLTEELIAGANLLRVDIPHGESFRTAYYGPSAIYAVHVTDEKAARAAAGVMGKAPPYAYLLESATRRLPSPDPSDDDGSDPGSF